MQATGRDTAATCSARKLGTKTSGAESFFFVGNKTWMDAHLMCNLLDRDRGTVSSTDAYFLIFSALRVLLCDAFIS